MKGPFWFHLIRAWRMKKHGAGLTLPFIVGADARARKAPAAVGEVRHLMDEIRSFEDQELIVIRWCPWRFAPVIGAYLFRPGKLEVDDQLLGDGLTEDEFLERLVRDTEARVAIGDFSRIGMGDQARWAPFTKDDLEFIDSVIADSA